MSGTLLRERGTHRHAPVTSVELFFDLVFVFAITRLSHHLLEHLGVLGAVQAVVLLLAVWMAWNYTAWITNWLDPQHPLVRLVLFAVMGAGLLMSTSIPEAFHERGLVFAASFVALQLGRTLFILWAMRHDPSLRRNFIRVAIWTAATGIAWIGGAWLAPPERLALWSAAVALDYLGPGIGFRVPGLGRTATGEWTVEGGHLAERCGLFIMICLGESILVIGATVGEQPWTAPVLAAFSVAFLGALASWWIYFSLHAAMAQETIAAAADPGHMGLCAYTYGHIPLVAGIILEAVGDELVLAHPGGHTAPATALVVIAGPAVLLAGMLLFKRTVFKVWSPPLLVGLGLLVPVAGASLWASPLLLTTGATAVLVVTGLALTRSATPRRT